MGKRLLYFDGPGDLIGAFRHWQAGAQYPGEVAATYSSQIFEAAKRLGLELHAVAWPGAPDRVVDGDFVVEHRPRPWPRARGAAFYAAQALWAADLMRVARRFRPDVTLLFSAPHPFLFAPLAAMNTRIVVVLHNTLWPANYPPRSVGERLTARANGWFFRTRCDAVLALSPECERQVRQVAGGHLRGPIIPYRPRFTRRIADPPLRAGRPFRILFASRLERSKGIHDVVDAAARLEAKRPGDFHWMVCGGGGAEAEVARSVEARGLARAVTLRGQLARTELLDAYAGCDAVIVPTTAAFAEGLAKVALEAALAGRPVIVSDTVPAGDVLGQAAKIVKAGDVEGYVAAVERLADDPGAYTAACSAAVEVSSALLDPAMTLEAVVERTVRSMLEGNGALASAG